nr:eS25 family ribosomal protein [Candidatus Baldrarchaeota archaeon]
MAQKVKVRKKKKYGKVFEYEPIIRDAFISDDLREKLEKEIPKMKVISPTEIALRYNIKISTAKDFLEELEQKGLIKLAVKNRRVRIYVPVKAA